MENVLLTLKNEKIVAVIRTTTAQKQLLGDVNLLLDLILTWQSVSYAKQKSFIYSRGHDNYGNY
ncbi:hypothetical protein P344_01375 [Spiroplasma mirum ATCC 29335]|uniref:Uncharacterized protein n=1 Tax=Spiroplasma mirum ATCC 29335 TaxID=838561 RepID=W6ALQ7_9MOLU|nr:hypothetical protein P344_01375 [Spiroplasma mirum ATCC 29335]